MLLNDKINSLLNKINTLKEIIKKSLDDKKNFSSSELRFYGLIEDLDKLSKEIKSKIDIINEEIFINYKNRFDQIEEASVSSKEKSIDSKEPENQALNEETVLNNTLDNENKPFNLLVKEVIRLKIELDEIISSDSAINFQVNLYKMRLNATDYILCSELKKNSIKTFLQITEFFNEVDNFIKKISSANLATESSNLSVASTASKVEKTSSYSSRQKLIRTERLISKSPNKSDLSEQNRSDPDDIKPSAIILNNRL